MQQQGYPGKESACKAGDPGSIPGSGRSPEEGMATHCPTLAWRIPVDRGAWRATVHGIANSRRLLKSGYAQHSTRDITEAQSIEYFKAVQ